MNLNNELNKNKLLLDVNYGIALPVLICHLKLSYMFKLRSGKFAQS